MQMSNFFEGSFYCQNEKLNTATAKFEQVFETSAAFESAFWKCNSKKLTNTDINNLLLIKQQHRRSKYLTFINKIDSFLRYNIFFLYFFYRLWTDEFKIESLLMTVNDIDVLRINQLDILNVIRVITQKQSHSTTQLFPTFFSWNWNCIGKKLFRYFFIT